MPSCRRLALLAFALLTWSAGTAASTLYDFTLLPSLGGTASSASDINEAGQIVGSSKLAGDTVSHATLWTAGQGAIDLAPNGGATMARRINDRGQIIGELYPNLNAVGGSGDGQSLFWQSPRSAPIILAPLTRSATSDASGINNAGRIVGTSYENSATAFYAPHPTSWNPPAPIGPDPGRSYAEDINAAGTVVGATFDDSGGPSHPVVWRSGQRASLADLPGAESVSGLRINDAGVIAGTTWIPSPSAHEPGLDHNQATLWEGATVTPLPALGGLGSVALGLDNLGQVVGWSDSAAGAHATLWKAGVPVDLNSFVPASDRLAGWTLLEATAINDLGWIVGDAVNRGSGQAAAFVLSVPAVPEPATQVLMLVGMALIAAAARRGRSAIR